MANIILTSNAQFQPFSYQELAVPIMHQQQVHDAVAEEYDKLSSQADVLEAMAMKDGNSEAYRRYKAFSDSLRDAADRLYANGLDSQTKLTMHGLKRRYNSEIVPIQNAWLKRGQEAKLQMEASVKDPSLMFSRNAGNTSLDWYMNNPEGGFNIVSGNNIRAGVMAAAKNFQKKLMSDSKEAIKLKKDDPELYYTITRYGLDINDIENWQNHPALKKMVDDVMKANGVSEERLGDSYQDIYNQSVGHAGLGLWDAVGEDKVEYHTPPTSKKGSGSGNGFDGLLDINPIPTMMQDLPLILADPDTKEQSEKYATAIGFGKNGNSSKFAEFVNSKSLTGGVQYPGMKNPIYDPAIGISEIESKDKVRLFDAKTHRMLSKSEFVAQAKNQSEKSNLADWYNTTVTPALEYFGFGVGTTPTAKELGDAYAERYNNASAGTISGIDITANNPENWRKMGASNAYPVKGYNRETGMQAASSATTLGQLLDEVKDSDSNAVIDNTYLTNYQGQKALLFNIQRGGKVTPYAVPLNTGNSAIAGAVKDLDDAEEQQKLYNKYKALYEQYLNNGMLEEAEQCYVAAERAKLNASNLYTKGLMNLNNSQAVYSQTTIPTWSKPTLKELGYGEQ